MDERHPPNEETVIGRDARPAELAARRAEITGQRSPQIEVCGAEPPFLEIEFESEYPAYGGEA